MYKIYINNELVMTTVFPSYCYYDNVIKSWRTCDEPQAEAVYITPAISEEKTTGYYADSDYKPHRHEGFPVATIVKEEA